MQHDWVKSTLGHGETMCSRCLVTNREAAALGVMDRCDAPTPTPANDAAPVFGAWPQERIDQELDEIDERAFDDESDGSEECGRWDNGRLVSQCSKAGSEECDWECPIGLPSRRGGRKR